MRANNALGAARDSRQPRGELSRDPFLEEETVPVQDAADETALYTLARCFPGTKTLKRWGVSWLDEGITADLFDSLMRCLHGNTSLHSVDMVPYTLLDDGMLSDVDEMDKDDLDEEE